MRALRALPAVLLVASFFACNDSTGPGPADEGLIDGIQTNLTDPSEVVAAHGEALGEMSFDAYMALLDPEFRFCIHDGDAADFPWLESDWWPLDVESGMIGNMMDPEFSGDEPAVESIQTHFTILNIRELDSGLIEVTADAHVEVLIGPNDGWNADTRFIFTLVSDGMFYKILKIREVEKLTPRSTPPVIDPETWGSIKAAYRERIRTNLTDPAEVVAAHGEALSQKSCVAYMALLDPEFRYYIFAGDAIDFPWLTEDWWPLAVESEMIRNMMDPDFSGDEPPVERISAQFTILNERELGGGLVELTADAFLEVLIGPNDGWNTDTRFVFTMAPDGDGYFRIRSIQEVEKLRPAPAVEEESWGKIKSLYR